LPRKTLGQGILKAIHGQIDSLYDKAKSRFLSGSEGVFDLSLPGIFGAASREEYNKPDPTLLKTLVRVAEGYIDSQRENIKSQVTVAMDAVMMAATHKRVREDFQAMLNEKLAEIWTKATDGIEKIISSEINTAKNMATLDGITKVSAAYGIDDPTVYFAAPLDTLTCQTCLDHHFTPDGKNPRLWKLSELNHGYTKKGDGTASVHGAHPRCRGTLTLLLPGYSFNGMAPVWKSEGHDEYSAQRSSQ